MRNMLKQIIKTVIIVASAISATTLVADTAPATNMPAAQPQPSSQFIAKMRRGPAPQIIPSPPVISSNYYVVLDTNTGKTIAQKNMNKRRPPASLTKLMTLYLVFGALDNGQIKLDDRVPISHKAWSMGGSKMFVKEGSSVPVADLVQGIIVASGNDACVAMAQFLAGNEKTFAKYMNQAAQHLGMTHSHFVDSTGLPDPNHYSTAGDLSILASAIIHDYPQYYHFFKEKWFSYNGIRQPNRNRLLWRDDSVDGLKTGHTKAAGYCLIASAKRNMRLLSVVLGTPSDSARANDSQALLNYGFRYYTSKQLYSAGETISSPRVWLGDKTHVALGVDQNLDVTLAKNKNEQISTKIEINPRLTAPINKGQLCGAITISDSAGKITSVPLIALENISKGGWFSRMRDRVGMMFTSKKG